MMIFRFRSDMKAPPPVDRMQRRVRRRRRITCVSRSRKKASPSRSKISAMVRSAARSISASESRNGTRSSRATALPIAVLPAPIIPTSATVFFSRIPKRHVPPIRSCFPEWRDLEEKAIYNGRKPPETRRPEAMSGRGQEQRSERAMGRILLKLVAFLVVVGALGLVGFGYLGDLSPDQSDVSVPVTLDAE
jgi:cobalamin biosynthesis Mg chelatase CobN